MSTFEEKFRDSIEVQYKLILASLCKCDTQHAAVAAEKILHAYEAKVLSGATHLALSTTMTYNNLITCWVNSDASFYPPPHKPAYEHSLHPPANILCEMLYLYKQDPEKMSRINPDYVTFSTVIGSLSIHKKREQNSSSAQYTKELKELGLFFLKEMLQRYREDGMDCAPDKVTFTTVLSMFLTGPPDKEDGYRASQVLDEMLDLSYSGSYIHDVTPSAYHFNVVLGLMADQNRPDRSILEKAKEYVARMDDLADQYENDVGPSSMGLNDYFESSPTESEFFTSSTNSRPDRVTYNSLIKIASNAGMPQEAEDLLSEMIKRSNAGDELVKPDVISFNTVSKSILTLLAVDCTNS